MIARDTEEERERERENQTDAVVSLIDDYSRHEGRSHENERLFQVNFIITTCVQFLATCYMHENTRNIPRYT